MNVQFVAVLDDRDVRCLLPFGAVGEFELDRCSFREGTETITNNRGKVHENVFAAVGSDESVTLRVIKPLDGAGVLHSESPFCAAFRRFRNLLLFRQNTSYGRENGPPGDRIPLCSAYAIGKRLLRLRPPDGTARWRTRRSVQHLRMRGRGGPIRIRSRADPFAPRHRRSVGSDGQGTGEKV